MQLWLLNLVYLLACILPLSAALPRRGLPDDAFVWPPATRHQQLFSSEPEEDGSEIAFFTIAVGGERVKQRLDFLLSQLNTTTLCKNGCVMHVIFYSEAIAFSTQLWRNYMYGQIRVQMYHLPDMPEKHARRVQTVGDHLWCSKSCLLYLIRPYLHLILPSVPKVISLDLDLLIVQPERLKQLWYLFNDFRDEEILALTHEMQPTYIFHVFQRYRKALNYSTLIGLSAVQKEGGFPGFNGGVQLLHLERMRASLLYNNVIDIAGLSALRTKYLASDAPFQFGDQDLYSLIGAEYPQLFRVLPCGWNLQLCRGMFLRYKNFHHNCRETATIIHNNCAYQGSQPT